MILLASILIILIDTQWSKKKNLLIMQYCRVNIIKVCLETTQDALKSSIIYKPISFYKGRHKEREEKKIFD